ncbi:MAG TPA: hypothetical protein VE776_05235, partial [Actinomycetota bacterium]|nr:hypothetical protein [Actinomycetota bacterium]
VAVAAVLLALVAGAFAAGRLSRPSSGASAAEPTTTRPSGVRTLPGGGLASDISRVFGWSLLRGTVTVTLKRITATGSTTRITLEASGLERGWAFGGVVGLRLLDSSGRPLPVGLPDGTPLAADDLLDLGGGSSGGTIEIPRRIDPNTVGGASVTQIVQQRRSREHLRGTLVDTELKRQMDTSPQNPLDRPGGCSDCTLEVHCADCETVRVMGSEYRAGRVLVLLSQKGRARAEGSLASADILVSASGPGGQIGSFQDTAEGGDTVVEFTARELAGVLPRGQERMGFDVTAGLMRTEFVNGPWRLDARGGQR